MKEQRTPLELFYRKNIIEAGCDEAGRGCLAGPVVAASVILPPDFDTTQVADSKQMTAAAREQAREYILDKALAWAVGVVSPAEIDRINILQASFQAMHIAIEGLSVRPDLLLIDGHCFRPYPFLPHVCIIKGDGKYAPIAAASILAKTHRDALMRELHEQFPHYGWSANCGYPTLAHRLAIKEFGPTPYHRFTFAGVKDDLEPLPLE